MTAAVRAGGEETLNVEAAGPRTNSAGEVVDALMSRSAFLFKTMTSFGDLSEFGDHACEE